MYAIPPTDLFDTFTETFCVRYNNMTLGFNFILTSPVVPWLLAPSGTSLEGLLSLLSTLSNPHLGYLHCVSAFLRWAFSPWRSSGLLQTVWALCERVWVTLTLAERWWLSHCRYWSVWVSFLYTVIHRVPSTSGFTMVSKKGMAPSSLLVSTVNWMAGLTLLMCWRKCVSTYLHQNLGVGAVLRAYCSKYSIYKLATIGLTSEPLATPSTCS